MINRLLAILIAALPLVSNAQLAVGEWELFNSYDGVSTYENNALNDPFTGYKLVDTPRHVYYVSQNGLFSYDKDTQETYAYSATNKLSDSSVKGIWYNYSSKYLLIAYESGNIDLLYDDGKIVNLPDIKDAVLTTSKTVNDVAFANNRIYAATAFGVVIFDDKEYYVVDSGIYKASIKTLAVVGDYLVILSDDSNYPKDRIGVMCYISLSERINSLDKFTNFPWNDGWQGYSNSLRLLKDNKVIVRARRDRSNYQLSCVTLNFNNRTAKMEWLYEKSVDYPALLKDGRYFVKGDNELIYINTDGTIETVALSSPLTDQAIAMYDGPSSLWTANNSGIAQLDITTSPSTVKNDYFMLNSLNMREAGKLKFSPSNRLYINQLTKSNVLGTNAWWLQRTSIFDEGKFTDATTYDVTKLNEKAPCPDESTIRDVSDIVEDPDDPDTYYAASLWEGVFKLTKNADGKYVEAAHYYTDNSTFYYDNKNGNFVAVPAMAFDRFGNLWCVNGKLVASDTEYPIHILPAAARKKETVTESDWIRLPINNLGSSFDSRILICEKSNMVFMLDGVYGARLLAYDTKGTASFDDDTYYIWEKWTDQDGKEITQGRATAIVEGLDGKVWIGTANGIIEISNPNEATNPNMKFNRIKVPRNDGSGFADYLLDTQQVLSLAVDGTNRKWAGTQSSGLFYISASGDEIIESHDIDNSVLTDNCIYALACDLNGSDVFVATPDGVFRYNSKVAPGADDYSNVYAFPNPVRPGYTGWITIKGLIDGSRVKIADASGSVFLDTVSEGGMITWDGCNRNGERVRTGVYYVYASKSGEGINTQGAVTKILVVN